MEYISNETLSDQNSSVQKKTITVKMLQEVLNLSYHSTMQLVHREDFPKITVGRRILIIEDMLDSWFENNVGLTI